MSTALQPREMAAAARALDRLGIGHPPIVPAPPVKPTPSFPPGERFEAKLAEEAAEERRVAREAAKLPTITIVIEDQVELRRLHEIASHRRGAIIPAIRCHLRGWSRDELQRLRLKAAE